MLECDVRALLAQALPGSLAVDAWEVQRLGRMKGAYAVLLHVATPVRFERRIGAADLSGWFVYAGSAYGVGGIGARLARHFRRDKPLRWHIDQLTITADKLMAFAIPDGNECDIIAKLLSTGQFETALHGFGSSDCSMCATHLLRPISRV